MDFLRLQRSRGRYSYFALTRKRLIAISSQPSIVTMPFSSKPYPTILEFLGRRFPGIRAEIWAERLTAGKLLDEAGKALTLESRYRPQGRLLYFREVEKEPVVPFVETILYQDEDLLVADKPHFLPVTPGGRFVAECLLGRLQRRTGLLDLAPLHRIDRGTAGIVLFSVNKGTRSAYARLWQEGEVEKSYLALSAGSFPAGGSPWLVENRIVAGDPPFRMQVVPGAVNARSLITQQEDQDGLSAFLLQPLTGKTHQLRLHLCGLGGAILNDRYYPELQVEEVDNFAAPLQLLARTLRFRDPRRGVWREFVLERTLQR